MPNPRTIHNTVIINNSIILRMRVHSRLASATVQFQNAFHLSWNWLSYPQSFARALEEVRKIY